MRHNFRAIHLLGKYSCRAIYIYIYNRQSWTIFVLFDSFAQMTLDGELKICSFSRTEQISNELGRNLQLSLLRKIYGLGLGWSLWIARKVESSKAMTIFWDKSQVWMYASTRKPRACRHWKIQLRSKTIEGMQGKVLEEAHIFGLSVQTQTNQKEKDKKFVSYANPTFFLQLSLFHTFIIILLHYRLHTLPETLCSTQVIMGHVDSNEPRIENKEYNFTTNLIFFSH